MSAEENFVVKEVIDYINNGLFKVDFKEIELFDIERINNVGFKGRKSTLKRGHSDLQGELKLRICKYAIPVYIEIKKPSTTCKDIEQLNYIQRKRGNGCIAFWSNSIEDFKLKLRDFIIEIIYN